jgi:hypothetical protein
MTTALDIANASGFPLQIAVENYIRQTEAKHRWRVFVREHAWTLGEDSGFIDLVLVDRPGTFYLTVECKRVRESSWVFLPWDGDPQLRRHMNAWVSSHADGRGVGAFGWHDLSGSPDSPEVAFCSVKGQDPSGQRTLLERVGSELILSTEALARELRGFRHETLPDLKIHVAVIVTTAKLTVANFNPDKLSLKDGNLPADTQFEEVPFVRFRKQLSAKPNLLTPADYANRHLLRARENTVFVVNADQGLVPFLTTLDVDNGPLNSLCG